MESVTINSDATSYELAILADLAAQVPTNGVIVEIGTGMGGSALQLRNSSIADIYTIDPCMSNDLASVLGKQGIYTLTGSSIQASQWWEDNNKDIQIDLLFIDGGHDFKSLIYDVFLWLPRLTPDGIVVFDDYEDPLRGGLANLAVKITLDTLIETGVISPIQRDFKMLRAKVNRNCTMSDVDVCYVNFHNLDTDDETGRAICEKLARALPTQFWPLYSNASHPTLFRQNVETFNMLQLTRRNIPDIPDGGAYTDRIEWLSSAIAFKQVELNILRQALKALRGAE